MMKNKIFSEFVSSSLSASKEICQILQSADSEKMQLLVKKHSIGAGGDVSIEADLLFERIFTHHLLEIADIDSEESGLISKAQGIRDVVILDPLDGSDNFLSNIPYFGASLALKDGKSEEIKEAIIINFCTKTAIAKSNNEILKLSLNGEILHFKPDFENLKAAKCGIFEKAYSNPQIAQKMLQRDIKFRSLGASALSIALALECNFFLFIGKIRKFDCAAGLFIAQGLKIAHTDEFLLISKDKNIFEEILSLLQG